MLKDKLREAIESRNWGLACDFYEAMFGEVIEMPLESPEYLDVDSIKKKALEIIEECSVINTVVKDGSPKKEPQSEQETDKPEVEAEDVSSDTSSTGSVTAQQEAPEPQFISSDEFDLPEDEMEGYKQAVASAHKKRKKTYREEYKANMRVCPTCGLKFDFNKEYPAGMLESSREPKCNKCRAIPS